MRKFLYISILCLFCCSSFAQQSCYEQYIREHNMTYLTAEDADDSYDELKKEIIARQILRGDPTYTSCFAPQSSQSSRPASTRRTQSPSLHQPIVLAIDTTTGVCHLLAEDGTILADARIALVDSIWYMWLSVDPLADKYPNSTPYIYCNGNPIKFIDPDGKAVFPSLEQLRCAANQAMTLYQPDKQTYCNLGAQMINRIGEGPSFSGSANDMGVKLRDSSFATKVTSSEAISYANEGVTVFASWVNKKGGHGHIAVVAPSDELVDAGSWGKSVNVFNIGLMNEETAINNVFSKSMKSETGFYVIKADVQTLSRRVYNGGTINTINVVGDRPSFDKPSNKLLDVKRVFIPEINF